MGTVQPLRRKVAIVGTAPSYIEAPTGDSGWEVWGLNGAWSVLNRWDRWFEMHTPTPEHIAGEYGAEYVAWLGAAQRPVYMQDIVSWVPRSVQYPIEKMAAEFGEVWACTPTYMLALAISEGFTEIGIFGMDLTGGDEYLAQREWIQHLIGFARGRGIKVTFPESGSALERFGFRYGYEAAPVMPGGATVAALREHAVALKHREQATADMHQAEGARKAFGAARRAMADGLLNQAFIEAALAQVTNKRDRAVADRLEWEGAAKAAARVERNIEHVARGGAA